MLGSSWQSPGRKGHPAMYPYWSAAEQQVTETGTGTAVLNQLRHRPFTTALQMLCCLLGPDLLLEVGHLVGQVAQAALPSRLMTQQLQ